MILDRRAVTGDELRQATGWEVKPEGACKDDVCVPLAGIDTRASSIDVRAFADRMGMPLAEDNKHGLWALGPRAGGRVLEDTLLPEVVLADFEGNNFDVAGLRGRKVMLLAWASW